MLLLAVTFAGTHAGTQADTQYTEHTDRVVEDLQKDALSSDLAWDILASLTSEVGPRMGGTEADARAVTWAVEKMHALGFDHVWTEAVTFPRWVRRSESAEVVFPGQQRLVITALGGSPATDGPVEAEVVQYEGLEALKAASEQDVRGKIVFLSSRMPKSQTGQGYGETVGIRSSGPFVAAGKGASALLIRSVGTDSDRLPHTGAISASVPGERVPSAALSNPDADNLMIMLSGNQPVRVRMNLDVGFDGDAVSQNVIGEFTGSGRTGKRILIGAHLDSWDLGTGAIDDGAGVALVMAAARLVSALPGRPMNDIRVVLYANEEQGIFGGREYAERYGADLANHLVGAESDLGADRIYRFKTRVGPEAAPVIKRLAWHLARLGIEDASDQVAGGGADVGQMGKLGMPVIDLNQDATRYFDLHHKANDTLDKVDPEQLRQNLAAWVTLAWLTADSRDAFGPLPPAP